jgi:hypothetical protein
VGFVDDKSIGVYPVLLGAKRCHLIAIGGSTRLCWSVR